MINRAFLEQRLNRLPEVEAQLSDPGVMGNPRRLRDLVREHNALKALTAKAERYLRMDRDITEHRELLGSGTADPEFAELARLELAELEPALPQAEQELLVSLVPPEASDERNAIFEIRAGTGGDEAGIFAGDLFRLYTRYAERRGWKVQVMDASPAEMGGYKEVVFTIVGAGAYGALKYESGGHRVQRVPVTESQGRIHTSAATVAVFPEADESDEIEIRQEDLRIDTYRASGAGGQHVNRTDSAVRITHLPTGIVVQSQEERSQPRNRDRCMTALRTRLLDAQRQAEQEKISSARRSLTGTGDRSERIRTYNYPQNRLTDHRINLTLYSLTRYMEGEIDEVLHALQSYDVELRLKAEMDKGQSAGG